MSHSQLSVESIGRLYFKVEVKESLTRGLPDAALNFPQRHASFSTAFQSNDGSRSTSPMRGVPLPSPPPFHVRGTSRPFSVRSMTPSKVPFKKAPSRVSPSRSSIPAPPPPGSEGPAADHATRTFLHALVLPPPLQQFYSEERTLCVSAGIRQQQQGLDRKEEGGPRHARNHSLLENNTRTRRVSLLSRGRGCLGDTGVHSPTGEKHPAAEDEGGGALDGFPNTFGAVTLNSFVLHSRARLCRDTAEKAACPSHIPFPHELDTHATYYSILEFFAKRYGPLEASHRGDDNPEAPGGDLVACDYGYWERYVHYFPDVYANFAQSPVFCLMRLYEQLPRHLQKGLDALATLVQQAPHVATSAPRGASGGNSMANSAMGGALRTRWDDMRRSREETVPDVPPSTVSPDVVLPSPIESIGSTAIPDDVVTTTLQFPGSSGLYDDISALINGLLQCGDRHVALHVILATCRCRPMDRRMAAFQHILSALPSIKMTTVALAMEAWRILHNITPRSTDYLLVAQSLVHALSQQLSHHGDLASLMTGLVGIRHIIAWESYTYQALVVENLEALLLGVWAVLFQDGGAAASDTSAAMGELAAATLRELFSVALSQNRQRLIQNCVAQAINCIAQFAFSLPASTDSALHHGLGSGLTSSSEAAERISEPKCSANTFPDTSFDMSFSLLCCSHNRTGWGHDSVPAGTCTSRTTLTLGLPESITNEFEFSAEIQRIGVVTREEDGVSIAALVLGAFLSAWHHSAAGRSKIGGEMEKGEAERAFQGFPIPLLAEEEQGVSSFQMTSSSSLKTKQAEAGVRPRDPFDPEWNYLTAERANELFPPMNVITPLITKLSALPTELERRETRSEAFTTQSDPRSIGEQSDEDVVKSSPASSDKPPQPSCDPDSNRSVEKQELTVDYFLPVEVVKILVSAVLPRSASSEFLPSALAPKGFQHSSVVALERLLPLLVRSYGHRLPAKLLAQVTLQVVNRVVRDLKEREEQCPVTKDLCPPVLNLSPLAFLSSDAENPEKDAQSTLPSLLNAATLLSAVAPVQPQLFEVLFFAKFAECMSYALRYNGRSYSSSALPALGLLVHNFPQSGNAVQYTHLVERLMQVAMSAPFSMVQAVVTESIGGVMPSIARLMERWLLCSITKTLEMPDPALVKVHHHCKHQQQHRLREDGDHKKSRETDPPRERDLLTVPSTQFQPFRPLSLAEVGGGLQTPSLTTVPLGFPGKTTPIAASTSPSPILLPVSAFHHTLAVPTNRPVNASAAELSYIIAKKRLCFQILQLLRHFWEHAAGFALEHCLSYTRHRDASLRFWAVTCCALLSLVDCYHDGHPPPLLQGVEEHQTPGCTHLKQSRRRRRQGRAVTSEPGKECAISSPVTDFSTIPRSLDTRDMGDERLPEKEWEDDGCDQHCGVTHVNTLRAIVHRLVDVAVSDPESHVRLTALQALRQEVMQLIYPHHTMVDRMFVALNDVSLRNRTEAVRVLRCLAPYNPAVVYPRLRAVFLYKLDHFVRCCSTAISDSTGADKLASVPGGPTVQRRDTATNTRGGKRSGTGEPCDTTFGMVDEDLSLLIEITGTLLASSTLYLSHLLSMLQFVLRFSVTHSRSTVINVLRLLTQLHDNSSAEDWPLFEPFLTTVAKQLMIRDGDTERLLGAVSALQSLYQSRVAEYSLAPNRPEQQLTVRWLHSLNYQKPSIGPSLSVAILKLLGTISSKESCAASQVPEYNQQLPLLLQRPRDLYEVPRLSYVAGFSSTAHNSGQVLVPLRPQDAVSMSRVPHVLRPFSPSLWPDMILCVVMHSLLDHINYTTTLTPDGIKDCLDTILDIMCHTEARCRAVVHLPSFLSIFLHLAYCVPEDYHRLPVVVAARVLKKISSVIHATGRRIGPLFPLLHSLVLREWNSGRRLKQVCCCRILETLTTIVPQVMKQHAEMWVNELLVALTVGQDTTEADGAEILQLHIHEGKEDMEEAYHFNRLFESEPMRTGEARWYGITILFLAMTRTLLALLPLAPPRVTGILGCRLPYLLLSSGLLSCGADTAKLPLNSYTCSPTVSTDTTDSGKFSRERGRRDVKEEWDSEVCSTPMLYDQVDLMGSTRERLGAVVNRSLAQVMVAYFTANDQVDGFAATVVEQCLQRLTTLAEYHRNALQRVANWNRSSWVASPSVYPGETISSREEEELRLQRFRKNIAYKERAREGLWREESPMMHLSYSSTIGQVERVFPFEWVFSWETCAEMDLLACIFVCYSCGGEGVEAYRHPIEEYINNRFGENSVVSAFFRCASMPTYRLIMHDRGLPHVSTAHPTMGLPEQDDSWYQANALPDATHASDECAGLPPAPHVVTKKVSEDGWRYPSVSLSHAASAETLNFDDNSPFPFPFQHEVFPRSPPVPIVGQHPPTLSSCHCSSSPRTVSSYNESTHRQVSPPSSNSTDLPGHEERSPRKLSDNPYVTFPFESAEPAGSEVVARDGDGGERELRSVESTPSMEFLNAVPLRAQDGKQCFDRTMHSWQDASRSPLLDCFEKHATITNSNMRDWKPWFEQFCFQLMDHCRERGVELCANLIKTHQFSMLYSDILGIAFLSNLEAFSEPQLSAFLKAFRSFYSLDRELPYSVASELLRLMHFLKLYAPALFSPTMVQTVVNAEIPSSFMVKVAERAMHPTLMMMYLEIEMSERFTWETINSCVSAYDDILVPFFYHAYFVLDPRLLDFLQQEDVVLLRTLKEEAARRSLSALWEDFSKGGWVGKKGLNSESIAAHLRSVPTVAALLQESGANPTFLAILGRVRVAAQQFLAPHQHLLEQSAHPSSRNTSGSPSVAASVETSGMAFTLPVQASVSFGSFVSAVLGAMRSYLWSYDFESILLLWRQVGDIFALQPCGPSGSITSCTRVFMNSNSRISTSVWARSDHELDQAASTQNTPAQRRDHEGSTRLFVSDDTSGNTPQDLQNLLSVLRYASSASTALSQWDVTLDISSAVWHVTALLHDELNSKEYRDSRLERCDSRDDGNYIFSFQTAQPSPALGGKHQRTRSDGGGDHSQLVPVQMEIDRAAALLASAQAPEAKLVLSRVRSLLLEETASSVFQTEHPRAKLELNCMYQQISDLEEGIHNLEVGNSFPSGPSLAEEQVNRRFRNIAFRPFTPNTSTLQRFRVLAARNAMVPVSWQIRNIFMLSEQIHQQGMPMRALLTLRHFQSLVAAEKSDSGAEEELQLECYRILLSSLSRVKDLLCLHSATLLALRRAVVRGRAPLPVGSDFTDSEDLRCRYRKCSATAPLWSSTGLCASEMSTSMTSYEANLLLLHIACSRRIANLGIPESDISRSPSQVSSPLMRSKPKSAMASPLMASEATEVWSSVDFGNFRLPPHCSPVELDATLSSQGSFQRHFSHELSESPLQLNACSPESLLINEYRLLEHTIMYSITTMPAVWSEFGLVLFDVCFAMHAEFMRTQEPETLQNFHAQSTKAINALQQAARLWRQQSHQEEGGIGTSPTTSHPRRRHARNALPTAHLVTKALYLAVLCEENPLQLADSDDATGRNGSVESHAIKKNSGVSGRFYDLDFSPPMYVYWATVQTFLINAAAKHVVLYRRVKEMCANSINQTFQFLPLLISSFEHPHHTLLNASSDSFVLDSQLLGKTPDVTYSSDMLRTIAQASPEHSIAVQETLRIMQFARSDTTQLQELHLNGGCKLPLPVWFLPLYSSVELDMEERTPQREKSPTEAVPRAAGGRGDRPARATPPSTVSTSWTSRGVMGATRRIQLYPSHSGIALQAEVIVSLRLTDGSEIHFHRQLPSRSEDPMERWTGLPSCWIPSGSESSPEPPPAHGATPMKFSELTYGIPDEAPDLRCGVTCLPDGCIPPFTMMELSINLFLAHLPLTYFRCPFIFPLDMQHFLTQLPVKTSRTNNWQSNSLPSSLHQTAAMSSGSGIALQSIWHIQTSFELLQQRHDIANIGMKVLRDASSRTEATPMLPTEFSSTAEQTDAHKFSTSLSSQSSHNRQEFFRLVSLTFDSGDPTALLSFLEQLLFTNDSDPSKRQWRSFEKSQEQYTYEVRLPRMLESLKTLYQNLSTLLPSDAPPRSLSSDVQEVGHRSADDENQTCNKDSGDSSQSLMTPLTNQETRADMQRSSLFVSAYADDSNSSPHASGPANEPIRTQIGSSGAPLQRRISAETAREVRLVLLRSESLRYRDGVQSAFHAEATYPSQWMEARRLFTQELAEWSLLQYMLDITDRNSCNFFINPVGGHVATHHLGQFALQPRLEAPATPCSAHRSDEVTPAFPPTKRRLSASTAEPLPEDLEPSKTFEVNAAAVLANPFPTRDACLFRLTKSLEKILWAETALATFLSYLAEGLFELHEYQREMNGIASFGLECLTPSAWKWSKASRAKESQSCSFTSLPVRYACSAEPADAVRQETTFFFATEREYCRPSVESGVLDPSDAAWHLLEEGIPATPLLERTASSAAAPPVFKPCFDCSSLRTKLLFSAPLSRCGDAEEANRAEAVALLRRECDETEAELTGGGRKGTANGPTEEQRSSWALSESGSRTIRLPKIGDTGADNVERSPSCPQRKPSVAHLRVDTASAYDWASLLISIARDETRLIGDDNFPHKWASWAPHW